ncbi:MAG: exodeoxyribonuclease VII small subunit [Rhodocyclaceae bacterium]
MTKTASKPQSFESAITELEELVERMETGSITLEEALTQYHRGVDLLRYCRGTLDKAEQRIKKLEADMLVRFDDRDDGGASE